MQTIKTEHGVYKISDTRDAAEFMRRLAKPAKRKPIPKMDIRKFPAFYPGETTTWGYILDYYRANGFDTTYMIKFKSLPGTPSPCYDPTQPLVEMHHD